MTKSLNHKKEANEILKNKMNEISNAIGAINIKMNQTEGRICESEGRICKIIQSEGNKGKTIKSKESLHDL